MTMNKSRRLRLVDVRAAYRLIGECRDLGRDPACWLRHALNGLSRLLGARFGVGGEQTRRASDGAIFPVR